ncbi:MAG: hypothetical protein ACRDF4_05380, partial [Rhabdochlamydiaceae bacterium]
MRKIQTRSRRPAPDFRTPYVQADASGNVSIPETKYVRGANVNIAGAAICKSSMSLGDLAQDLVNKYQITESNLETVGDSICRDYAHLEDLDYNVLFQEIAYIVEGPTDIPPDFKPGLIEFFRNTHRDWNSKGPDHPDTLRNKQRFEELFDGYIPVEIWHLPLRHAERAFLDWANESEEAEAERYGEQAEEVKPV